MVGVKALILSNSTQKRRTTVFKEALFHLIKCYAEKEQTSFYTPIIENFSFYLEQRHRAGRVIIRYRRFSKRNQSSYK
jgi:hypothetical protein